MPSVSKILSKPRVNLVSRSWRGKRDATPSCIFQARFLACCSTQARSGWRASGQMDATRTDLNEEEDVELGQPDRIDHEEVGRQQHVGVLAHELLPRSLATSWRRQHAVAAENVADSDVRDLVTELEQLARRLKGGQKPIRVQQALP